MRTTRPILYDRDGEIIGWFEQEIDDEKLANLRKNWAEMIKDSVLFTWRTPTIEDKD